MVSLRLIVFPASKGCLTGMVISRRGGFDEGRGEGEAAARAENARAFAAALGRVNQLVNDGE